MKFGVRQVSNLVFRAKQNVTIGDKAFKAGQPVGKHVFGQKTCKKLAGFTISM